MMIQLVFKCPFCGDLAKTVTGRFQIGQLPYCFYLPFSLPEFKYKLECFDFDNRSHLITDVRSSISLGPAVMFRSARLALSCSLRWSAECMNDRAWSLRQTRRSRARQRCAAQNGWQMQCSTGWRIRFILLKQTGTVIVLSRAVNV